MVVSMSNIFLALRFCATRINGDPVDLLCRLNCWRPDERLMSTKIEKKKKIRMEPACLEIFWRLDEKNITDRLRILMHLKMQRVLGCQCTINSSRNGAEVGKLIQHIFFCNVQSVLYFLTYV